MSKKNREGRCGEGKD
ncbi:HvfA family oxazolone/thioamide-modified RiPP metallophore [Microcoleus sp. A6-C5]